MRSPITPVDAIGEPCKLRATWNGAAPDVGDYLSSGQRARYAYVIVGVEAAPGNAELLNLRVVRVAPASVPDGARVHAWKWSPR